MCSTERARRRSRNSRNALCSKYEALQAFVIFCSGFSLATNSPAAQSWLLQNTATETKFGHLSFFYTGRFQFIYYFSFPFPDYPTTLNININNQWEEKQFQTANEEIITANIGDREVSKIQDQTKAIMAIHHGKRERFSGFAHCALISCRFVDGPTRLQNSNPLPHNGVETMKGDLQIRSVS